MKKPLVARGSQKTWQKVHAAPAFSRYPERCTAIGFTRATIGDATPCLLFVRLRIQEFSFSC